MTLTSFSLSAMLHEATKTLSQLQNTDAKRDARLLIQWIMGLSWSDLIMQPHKQCNPQDYELLKVALERRLQGESVHRIIGKRAFYGIDFYLSPHTLEPRPDTEILIDLALPLLQTQAETRGTCHCLDFGTGSGALAITLLVHQPKLYAVGVDLSQDALHMAQINARHAHVEQRFTPCFSDGFQNVTGKFDLIISNPPYIPTQDIASLDITVRNFDPILALNGGIDGLDFYQKLAKESHSYLDPASGAILVEIGYDQEQDVIQIFNNNGYHLQSSKKDLSNIPRALLFTQS